MSNLIETLRTLVAIPSPNPPGETTEICAFLQRRFDALGFSTQVLAEEPGCDNLIASMGSGAPHLVFNVHTDTVGVGDGAGWDADPLALRQDGDRLFGLGICNAKASIAVHLATAEALAAAGGPAQGTVSFTFVTDDENVGPRGASFLRRRGLKPDYLVLGGPTGNGIILEERGVMWVGVEARGRAAHAGAPSLGDNAIQRMIRMMAALERELVPRIEARTDGAQQATLNLGLITGGSSANVVPDLCRVEIDRRLLRQETVQGAYAEIVACLAAAGEPEGSWSSELMRGTNAFRAPEDGRLAGALAASVAEAAGHPPRYVAALGASDGRYFADDGIEIVSLGPGNGADSHCANEFVSLGEVEECIAIYASFLRRMVGRAQL